MNCSVATRQVDIERILAMMPFPAGDANKYSRGKAVIVAGSESYPGAAILAARAAQRMGAGYTEVYTDEAVRPLVIGAAPSLVVRGFSQLQPASVQGFSAEKPGAVCVGPGFDGACDAKIDLVFFVLEHAEAPVIVDGGGLAALCQPRAQRFLERRAAQGFATVLTPHGGEAARLAEAWEVQARDDAAKAQGIAHALGALVALKGPDTCISDGESVVEMREGTSVLAKAGTGDVLAGMVAACLAQGIAPLDAVQLATVLHARAGIEAAAFWTDISAVPEDLLDFMPNAIRASVNGAR